MKKLLLLISIVFTSFLAVSQNTGSLPYYQILQSRDTIMVGDTLIFHEESTGKYVKISVTDFKNAIVTTDTINYDSTYVRIDGVLSPLSYINDTLRIDTTKVPYFSGGISGPKNSSTYLNGVGVWDTITAGVELTDLSATSPLDYNNTTGVFSMPAAATAQNGYLTSTDWNTFNGKQPALVSGTNIKTLYGATLLGSGDAGIAPPTYGGTGVNNGVKTITLGGNLVTTGAFNATIAVPRTTTWTLPNTANETLAGLGTAQTFTADQTYTGLSNVTDVRVATSGSGYLRALWSPAAASLQIGSSQSAVYFFNNTTSWQIRTGTIQHAGAGDFFATTNGRFFTNAGPTLLGSASGNGVTIRSDWSASTPVTSGESGKVVLLTGNATTTGSSSSIFFDVGSVAGSGTCGGMVFFNSNTTPGWNNGQRIMFIGNRTASPTTNAASGTYFYANSGNLETTGSFYFPLIGTGIGVKTGTNGRLFTATLTAGTVMVSNTSVTTNTKAIITLNTGGAAGTLGQYTYTCTAGQIVVTSLTAAGATQTLDTSTLQIYLIEGL